MKQQFPEEFIDDVNEEPLHKPQICQKSLEQKVSSQERFELFDTTKYKKLSDAVWKREFSKYKVKWKNGNPISIKRKELLLCKLQKFIQSLKNRF